MTFKLCDCIVLILFTIIIVLGNIIRLWYFVKCLGVKSCNKRKCKYKEYCFRYYDVLTDEDVKELLKLLEKK